MDTLRPYLCQAKILDLYAGQGRLGFSAAKEGATEVTFVESNVKTLSDLKENAKHPLLKNSAFHFHKKEALSFLEELREPDFDLVFADPPFSDWENTFADTLLTHLVKAMKSSSISLVKHPARVVISSPVEPLQLWKRTVFGESALTYFKYGTE